MKRVLIISYYWPPSGGAGVQRWLKFAKFLPEFGWEPVIITVDPVFASYPLLDPSLENEISPEIKVIKTISKESFSAYKKVSGSEKIPYAGFANENNSVALKQKIARFIRGNFFLPDPRKGWNKYALKEARKLLSTGNFDCYITSSPPHSSQLIGLRLSKEFKIPWIADLRDPWTDIYYYKQFYPSRPAHRFNLKMEKTVLEQATKIITVGPSLKALFENKTKESTNKIEVISNGYDPDDFVDLPAPQEDKFVITYVGTLADIYPLANFLDAFSTFLKEEPAALLRFIGTVSPGQLQKILKLPPENVEQITYVEHRTAIEYMSTASALLLIIPDTKNNDVIVTGKLFEYLAVGRPIVFIGPSDGDGAEIIKKEKAGEIISYDDVSKMLQVLQNLKMQKKQTKPYAAYSRKNLTQKLAAVLNDLVL